MMGRRFDRDSNCLSVGFAGLAHLEKVARWNSLLHDGVAAIQDIG